VAIYLERTSSFLFVVVSLFSRVLPHLLSFSDDQKKERKFVTKEKVPFEIQNVLLSQKNAQLKRVDDV